MKNNFSIFLITLFIVLIYSCNKTTKIVPYGYLRIDFPEKIYEKKIFEHCDFSIEIPNYLDVNMDSKNECWITLVNKKNNINIHLSYHKVNNNLDSLILDSHNLVYEGHYRKADGIWETSSQNSNFTIYELSGEVATPIQFYVTDKKNHFLRGSMYPSTLKRIININRDSLAPVINFYKKDIEKIIESIEWN